MSDDVMKERIEYVSRTHILCTLLLRYVLLRRRMRETQHCTCVDLNDVVVVIILNVIVVVDDDSDEWDERMNM